MASPKLFELLNDKNPLKKCSEYVNDNPVSCRVNLINEHQVSFYKLGDVSDVKVGLQTGDNPAYLYQDINARGKYRDIMDYKEYILTDEDMEKIHKDEKLRLSIISNGISVNDSTSSCYFGGRYIVRYDKGGESDSGEGWMPNYYVPTSFYLDWSERAVKRMKTLTMGQRKIENN